MLQRAFYAVMHVLVTWSFRLYTRMSVHGREHVPRSGPFVLAPVHRSYVDTPIAGCTTYRRLHFMGKQEMWNNRAAGWMFTALGSFPVNRGTADREAIKAAIAVLGSGEGLVLFPEGERKSGPTVHPLMDGAVYIAVKAGVPIVPVGIGGSEWVMPKGARFVFPRKVHVEVGKPIYPPTGNHVKRSTVSDISAELHAELQRLFDIALARAGRTY